MSDHIDDASKKVPTPQEVQEAEAVLSKVQEVLRNEDLLFAADGLRIPWGVLRAQAARIAELEGRIAAMTASREGYRKDAIAAVELATTHRLRAEKAETRAKELEVERDEYRLCATQHEHGRMDFICEIWTAIDRYEKDRADLLAERDAATARAEKAEAKLKRIMEWAHGRCNVCGRFDKAVECRTCIRGREPGKVDKWMPPQAWGRR